MISYNTGYELKPCVTKMVTLYIILHVYECLRDNDYILVTSFWWRPQLLYCYQKIFFCQNDMILWNIDRGQSGWFRKGYRIFNRAIREVRDDRRIYKAVCIDNALEQLNMKHENALLMNMTKGDLRIKIYNK